MEEFQAASLNALFIAVAWSDKALGKRPHPFVGDRCELTVEVATLPDEELLHKLGTLRGGQVLPTHILSHQNACPTLSPSTHTIKTHVLPSHRPPIHTSPPRGQVLPTHVISH